MGRVWDSGLVVGVPAQPIAWHGKLIGEILGQAKNHKLINDNCGMPPNYGGALTLIEKFDHSSLSFLFDKTGINTVATCVYMTPHPKDHVGMKQDGVPGPWIAPDASSGCGSSRNQSKTPKCPVFVSE